MDSNLVKKSVVRFIFFLLFASVSSFLFVEYQIERRSGGYTDVVQRAQFKPSKEAIVLRDVNLLSPDGLSMIAKQSILLEHGKIAAIGVALKIPENAKVIDGSHQYLIPGLVDSHVHLENSPNDLLLYLANGVTFIRDMGGVARYLQWRYEIRKDHVGPSMYIASEKVNSLSGLKGWFNSWTRTRINISTPQQADALARRLLEDGFDAIKMSSFINVETYHFVAEAARTNGIPVTGHLPYSIGLAGLWTSGQIEVAHVEEITKALNKDFGEYDQATAAEFLQYVTERSNEVALKLRENDIAVTSTIWLMESLPEQKFDLEPALKQVALRYANPGIVEGTFLAQGWLPGHNSYQLNEDILRDEKAMSQSRIFWETYVAAIHIMTKALADNGVQLMAGTDANTAITVPGFSLHDELQSLTQVGLSNAQSLLTATAVPGEWMNSNTGKIMPGYRADLVLLEKNPLENIANTQKIIAVIKDGRVFDRKQLDAMLDAVRVANDHSRDVNIDNLSPLKFD